MNTKIVSLFLALVTIVISGCAEQQMPVQSAGDYSMGAFGPGSQQVMLAPVGVPPKSVGFLNFIPKGCGEPLQLEIFNNTDMFAAVQIDGLDLAVMGARGQLPSHIPPHSQVFLCLDEMGHHSITGTQYTFSGNRPIKMFDFAWSGDFTAPKRHSAQLTGSGISI